MSEKLYLSGPMTGYPDYNRAAFEDVENVLRRKGFEVVNPHKLPEPEGLLPETDAAGEEHNWRLYLARDLKVLLEGGFHAVAMLPGWRASRGAKLEREVAKAAGIKIVYEGL